MTGDTYLTMLKDQLMSKLENIGDGIPQWFKHDGPPTHFATRVRDWSTVNFSNWIGRRGHMERFPSSPDIIPHDFFSWCMLDKIVHTEKMHSNQRIRDECAKIDKKI